MPREFAQCDSCGATYYDNYSLNLADQKGGTPCPVINCRGTVRLHTERPDDRRDISFRGTKLNRNPRRRERVVREYTEHYNPYENYRRIGRAEEESETYAEED